MCAPSLRRAAAFKIRIIVLKRIAVEDLCAGMFVQALCGSWMEHPFWRTQFKLDDDDLVRLQSSGIREVWIDTDRGLDLASGDAVAGTREHADLEVDLQLPQCATSPSRPARIELRDEIGRARRLVREARSAVIALFNEARLGHTVDIDGALALVDRSGAGVARSPAAILSVARLKQADEYTFMHSVAVSGLMIALARQLQLPEDAVTEAGLAGLLHDLGKARLPEAILNKPAQLTDAEFESMRRHP